MYADSKPHNCCFCLAPRIRFDEDAAPILPPKRRSNAPPPLVVGDEGRGGEESSGGDAQEEEARNSPAGVEQSSEDGVQQESGGSAARRGVTPSQASVHTQLDEAAVEADGADADDMPQNPPVHSRSVNTHLSCLHHPLC